MNTLMNAGPVPVCIRDADGCPLYLTCGHYWKRCGAGCPGWGGVELPTTPADEARNARLVAAGLISTPASRAAGHTLGSNTLGGAA